MLKKAKFISGFVLGSVLFGSFGVYAATGGNMIEVFYNVKDIKINRVSKMPEENKPFIYNGSTYVPLRFVAEALGQPVDWDKTTQTVLIGQKEGGNIAYPGNGIESMNTQKGDINNSIDYVYNSAKKLKDNINKEYSSYIAMNITEWTTNTGAFNLIEFPLNGEYRHFKAKAGLTYETVGSQKDTLTLQISLDGKEVYSKSFKAGDFPDAIDLDVTNALKISIKISGSQGYAESRFGIFEPEFTK